MNVQGSLQHTTMAASGDEGETVILVNNNNNKRHGETESASEPYTNRNPKEFQITPRGPGTGKGRLLEKSYSAAFLLGRRKPQEAILAMKKNATSGGVKLEVRMPYSPHDDGDDDEMGSQSLAGSDSEHGKGDETEQSTGMLPASLKIMQASSSSKRGNKMSLDELLESNHSKIQHRRRLRRHHQKNAARAKGRMELRKTLSSGRIHTMSQSLSRTDIASLKKSLHGVQRKREKVLSDHRRGEEVEIPVESQATSCYEYTVVDDEDSGLVGEEDESSYEMLSYDSSSCSSSFLKSDNGSGAIGVDPVNYHDEDDASMGSGFSIEMHTEHCHSSITLEDWKSLFEESFAIDSVVAESSLDYYEESVSTFFGDETFEDSNRDHPARGRESLDLEKSKSTLLLVEEVVEDSVGDSEGDAIEAENRTDPTHGCEKAESAIPVEETLGGIVGGVEEFEHRDQLQPSLLVEAGDKSEHNDVVVSYGRSGSAPIAKAEKEVDEVDLREDVVGPGGSGVTPISEEKEVGGDMGNNTAGLDSNSGVGKEKELPEEHKDGELGISVNEREKDVSFAPTRKYRVANERFFIPKSTSDMVVADKLTQERVEREIRGAIVAASSGAPGMPTTRPPNGTGGNPTAMKDRKPRRRVAALIAMFEKNCQS